MEPTGHRGSALLTALGVLVALAVVAVAARGSTPVGAGGSSSPSSTIVDILFTLYIVALVAGGALLLYLLVLHRHARRSGSTGLGRTISNLVGLIVVLLLVGSVTRIIRDRGGELQIEVPPAPPPPAGVEPGSDAEQQPSFAWIPVLVTLGLLAAAALGVWWSERARRAARGDRRRPHLAEDLAAALDESLDDLRAEPDPRRAVIAAYARLERVLAGHGLPRSPAEAPLEYLARILTELSVGAHAAARLTNLFERAKFSQHAVGPEMKNEAIEALETVRDDLLVAREQAEQARRAALEATRQSAAH